MLAAVLCVRRPRTGHACFSVYLVGYKVSSWRMARTGIACRTSCACPNAAHACADVRAHVQELAGRYTIRLAVGAASTQLEHVQEAWQVVQAAATEVLAAHAATSTAAVAGQAKQ